MSLIRHCIVDLSTNKVINVIDYEIEQNGIPPGFDEMSPNWKCIANDEAGIGWDFVNGSFVDKRPKFDPSSI